MILQAMLKTMEIPERRQERILAALLLDLHRSLRIAAQDLGHDIVARLRVRVPRRLEILNGAGEGFRGVETPEALDGGANVLVRDARRVNVGKLLIRVGHGQGVEKGAPALF